MANHTLLSFGPYAEFTAQSEPKDVPQASVDGIHFGYAQLSGVGQGRDAVFLLVRIGKLTLRAPVLLIDGRHPWPAVATKAPAKVSDEQALHLLVDAIVANPELRDLLGMMIRTTVG